MNQLFVRGAAVRRPTLSLKTDVPEESSRKEVDLPSVIPEEKPVSKRALRKQVYSKAWATKQADFNHFFFIWDPAEQRPKRRHFTLESAQIEAARLRAAFPDHVFHVFEAKQV